MSIAEQFHIPMRPAKWLKNVENILIAKFRRVNTPPDDYHLTCWAFEVHPDEKLYLVGFRDNAYICEEITRFWTANHTAPFTIFTVRACYQAAREHSFTAYNDSMRILTNYSEGAILSTRDVANVVLP
jgi:hypothetical protein